MKKTLLVCLLAASAATSHAVDYVDWVNWDEIEHWAGDPNGEKKTALVIDFQDGQDDRAIVWGYRWNGKATGEDLVRAVASQSSALTVMIQYTGNMGSTLNAVGISIDREELDYLHYDFDRAAIGGEVSFDYFTPNTSMGQDEAPGYEAESMCRDAIIRAKETGVIEHPLNAFAYGYPAYDYDYWQLEDGYQGSHEYRWRAGWYEGYWSYWHGPNDYDYLSYSGLGMSSTELVDGDVHAWKYTPLNGGDGFGSSGGELAQELDYQIMDYNEQMHEAPVVMQPVDQSKVAFWVGDNAVNEKTATVVFQFNDGKGPENIVYGYSWTGGWDDNLTTVIKNICDADPRISCSGSGANRVIEFDSDCNGSFGDANDHTALAGKWKCYVKRTIDDGFNKVSDQRWLNPNAVMIVSCQPEEMTSVELPYQLFRPALDSDQIISIPETIEYALADDALLVPMFVQFPQGDKLNNAFTWTRPTMISTMSTGAFMGKVTAYKNFTASTESVKVRGSLVGAGSASATTVYSNECAIKFKNPVRPVQSMAFEQAEVNVGLKKTIENRLVYSPVDATYTKVALKSSDTKVATVNNTTAKATTTASAGTATITATYDFDNSVVAQYGIVSALQVPVSEITFDGADENGVITLTPKEMIGLNPVALPEDADVRDVTVALSGNGTSKADYVATMYQVNLWDENNVRTRPYELSGHRVGSCTLTVSSTDGAGYSREFTVNVIDREREPEIDYTKGTIMLNEEWFGHTNGGLNWYSPEYEVTYQAYERENPGMSFGATSQYGIIYGGKLIVSSKQAVDGGDPLPGGGRLVVADAATLKRIGSIDDMMFGEETRSADGRALVGAGAGKVYFGTSSGIYVVDIDNIGITGKITGSDPDGNAADLYSGQIGDMVLAGKHVFATRQSTGVYIIDTDTDEIVKAVADKNVQGITQDSNGNVWYATVVDKVSNFVCIDYNTLEEIDRVEVPAEYGTVACGWGAWRTTQFTASMKTPALFFAPGSSISNGGSGIYYRYDIDLRQFKKLIDINILEAHTPGVKQGAYGTIRYDDRNGNLIVGTTEFKASGHYRYNWTHIVDASTGDIVKTIELRPYYWFQSMPIFPDACDPTIEDAVVHMGDEPLTLAFSDEDNVDANIRVSLDQSAARSNGSDDVADLEINGHKITVTPKANGSKVYKLTVESNGRVVSHDFTVTVPSVSGISDPEAIFDIYAEDGNIVAVGLEGVKVSVCDAAGRILDSFVPDDTRFVRNVALTSGIYVVTTGNGISKKLVVR